MSRFWTLYNWMKLNLSFFPGCNAHVFMCGIYGLISPEKAVTLHCFLFNHQSVGWSLLSLIDQTLPYFFDGADFDVPVGQEVCDFTCKVGSFSSLVFGKDWNRKFTAPSRKHLILLKFVKSVITEPLSRVLYYQSNQYQTRHGWPGPINQIKRLV